MLTGCKKLPEYSNVPKISVNDVVVIRNYFSNNSLAFGDSIIIKINFEDGDGDLGIANLDSTTSKSNYILDVEKMTNGIYAKMDFGSGFYGKFPQLAASNVKGPIDGVLSRSIFMGYSNFLGNDTLRFNIQIIDRADNKSNTVVTDPVVIKKL